MFPPLFSEGNLNVFFQCCTLWTISKMCILESGNYSKHTKDEKVIGSSQPGFTKVKSYLLDLKIFYDEMTSLVNEGRVVDIV